MSSIKLKHSGGNGVSISAPDTNPSSDRTVKLPSTDVDGVITTKDSNDMTSAVNMTKPDVLFVGMTAPKQEKWVYKNKDSLKVKTICSIGAVFDFYSGNVKRPSSLWISLGLEWLPRFIKEPKRLFRRNMISTPKFIFLVLMSKIFKKELN